ncbi:MAG: ParB/RepB/Spo0J family partition protein [Lewinella sp.]|nr:ParB/RepB/Spo0J family partition protein [Lewinella sp.]
MAVKRKAGGTKPTKAMLGSGVEALFAGKKVEQELAENPEKVVKELSKHFAMIPLAEIERNPDQPRYDFNEEALAELAQSIKTHGIIQPLTVRYIEPHRYQIVSGERRWRASKIAELVEVPAYIRVADDQELLEMAIIENIQREDLNAMEIANSYQRLMDEFELTHDQLAERVGKKRSTITNYLRLRDLHESVQTALKNETITMGHARTIAGLDKLLQTEFLKTLLAKKWSVRQTEAQAKAWNPQRKAAKPKAAPTSRLSAEQQKILQDFKAFFGSGQVKMQLEDADTGVGQIVIPFKSHDELTELFKCVEQ